MEPQVQPLYPALFPTASGKCRGFDQKFEEEDKWRVKMEKQGKTGEDESPPSINLGLGVGGPTTSTSTSHCSSSYVREKYNSRFVKVEDDHDYYEGDQVVKEEEERERCRKLSVVRFTEEQLDEFKFQLLIFKYMVSGYPVPIQLLLPIWRGFSPSSAFSPLPCSYLYRRTPPFVGLFRRDRDNRSTMDAEPGRCRRTDGKKWRCHQSVVPAEKYCTRHMHRGSKRSRKLVEPPSTAGAAPNSRTFNHQINSSDQSFKFPAILSQKSQPLMNAFIKNPISSCSNVRDNGGEGLNYTTRVVIRTPSLTLTNSYAKSNEKDEDNHNDAVSDDIAVINLPSKLDFSSKSLLQGGERVGNHELDPNPEPGRCKRTDGKKWRCSKEVLPHQKYCAHHMYRGSSSKKPSSVVGCFSSSGAQFSGPDQAKMGFDPSTNLNISLPTFQPDPRPDSSGSTSETTVTDDSDSTDDSDIVAPRGVVLDV